MPTPDAVLKVSRTAERLRREILSGELPEGAPLRQEALARRLGVSTIPIREAIRWLEQEGLVACHPFQGAEVARLHPEEILEFAAIRIGLETEALARALPFHTGETLAECRRLLEDSRRADSVASHFDRYSLFIRSLYEPGAHPRLLAEILKWVARSQRYAVLHASILREVPPDLPMPNHILDALVSGDLPLAQARLRVLYRHTSILGAGLLYQRQLDAPVLRRRPRGRPRKVRPEEADSR